MDSTQLFKITEDGEEFERDMIIETLFECPYCREPDPKQFVTQRAYDRLIFKCLHCEEPYVLKFSMMNSVTNLRTMDESCGPSNLHIQVHKIDTEPENLKIVFTMYPEEE